MSIKNGENKFNKLIDDINELINNYVENNSIISKDELLTEMGFPNNFLALKWENVESSVNWLKLNVTIDNKYNTLIEISNRETLEASGYFFE